MNVFVPQRKKLFFTLVFLLNILFVQAQKQGSDYTLLSYKEINSMIKKSKKEDQQLHLFRAGQQKAREAQGDTILADYLYEEAFLYHDMGAYAKALPLYMQAKNIRVEFLEENHPKLINSLINLAFLYHDMGAYAKALPLFQECVAIDQKNSGEASLSHAQALNNLASLYHDMKAYAKALPLYIKSKGIRAKKLGKEDESYATSLNNLATLYDDMKDYEKALPLYQECIAIDKKV